MPDPTPCAGGCGYVPIGHKPEGWLCGVCLAAKNTAAGFGSDSLDEWDAFGRDADGQPRQ